MKTSTKEEIRYSAETMAQHYNLYVVIGGRNDGRTYPRTAAGLETAMLAGGDKVRPARVADEQSDDQDWDDYGLEIDRGNSNAFVKD